MRAKYRVLYALMLEPQAQHSHLDRMLDFELSFSDRHQDKRGSLQPPGYCPDSGRDRPTPRRGRSALGEVDTQNQRRL